MIFTQHALCTRGRPGALYFNEGGRYLAKYTGLYSAPKMATRSVVVDRAWLEDSSRCKKSDLSCRIEGFVIDTTAAKVNRDMPAAAPAAGPAALTLAIQNRF